MSAAAETITRRATYINIIRKRTVTPHNIQCDKESGFQIDIQRVEQYNLNKY